MEMRHGMPVWAPSDLEMSAIAKRVARERAKRRRDRPSIFSSTSMPRKTATATTKKISNNYRSTIWAPLPLTLTLSP